MTPAFVDTAPQPCVTEEPAVVPRARRRRDYTLLALLLLTLVGGILRFTTLDKPNIWGDEAATYGRVAGTYQELLDQLVDASFPPLHYELEWWIGQGLPYWGTVQTEPVTLPDGTVVQEKHFLPTHRLIHGGIPLSPAALRFLPALAGTLFIPAIYFLCRQLFGRRVSILTATLACFSAYLLNYSRDAKMYMEFWLALTLHVGCLLWWLRTRRAAPWALWILSGVAMVGLHASGFVIIGIDTLIFFTSPRQHWAHWFTIGGGLGWLAMLPIVGVREWRRRKRKPETSNDRWERFLLMPRIAYHRFRWPTVLFFLAGLAPVFLTAFGPYGFYSQFDGRYQRVTADGQPPIVSMNELGIGWVGPYNAGRSLDDYVLYTTSAYLTAWEWPRDFPELGINDRRNVEDRTFILLSTAVVGLLGLLAIGAAPWRKWLSPARARLERMTQDGRVLPAFVRWRSLWIGAWLVLIPYAIYAQSVPWPASLPDGVAMLALKSPPTVRWPRLRVPVTGQESLWHFYTQGAGRTEIAKLSTDAWRTYAAAFTRENIAWPTCIALAVLAILILASVLIRWRAMWRSSLRLAGVCVVLAVGVAVISILPRFANNSVWMPRYLGIVLPPFLMLVAVLITRQPSKWLRGATIALFIVVNLAQHAARVYGDSEPPSDLIAADVVHSQSKTTVPSQPEVPTFRAYTEFGRFQSSEPGGGTLTTPAGRYYLRYLSGSTLPSTEVREGVFERHFTLWRGLSPAWIDRDLKASPQIKTFVVWQGLDMGVVDQTDPLAEKLKGRYKRVKEELWTVRDHWRWYDRWQLRRRTYVKIEGGEAPLPPARPQSVKPQSAKPVKAKPH
ncbi:MAG: glycosyltransferase family 39 protein [Tepidisphaeraceae bacterium]